MANALKKITAEAKRIRRRHPGKSWKSAVKEAGREYRTGKLKTKTSRKKSRPKHKARRRVAGFKPGNGYTPREQVARTRSAVGSHRRKRRRHKRKPAPAVRRRRIGDSSNGSGDSMKMLMPLVLVGGLGLLAYAVLKKQSTPTVPTTAPTGLVQTGNQYRDSQASKIIAWATAGGLALDAITKLIQALNNSSDADVNQVADSIDSTGTLPYGFLV